MPSPDSRSSGAVGAIKREVGVVGVRRQSSKESVAHSSVLKSSSSTFLGKGIGASAESFGLSPALSKSNQLSQTSLSQPVMSFSGSQYNAKLHQQSLSQQKGIILMAYGCIVDIRIEYKCTRLSCASLVT